MFERGRCVDRAISCCVLLIFLCTFCAFLIGCGYYTIDRVENYDAFLTEYEKYGAHDTPIDESLPVISGFVPIIDMRFSFGRPFGALYAFVRKDNENYALRRDGALIPIYTDCDAEKFVGDKYVFESDGNMHGVCDILSNVLLAPEYQTIEMMGDTILATRDNLAEVYVGSAKVGQKSGFAEISLLSDAYVLVDGLICSLDFTEMRACGFPYADIPSEGIVMVNLGNGYVGYVELASRQRIGDAYIEAKRFQEGTGIVRSADGNMSVIDTDGNCLYSTRDRLMGSKNDGYYCYLQYNFYGVMDGNFQVITEPVFYSIKYERAVAGYLITRYGTGECLYSLKDRMYLTDMQCENIEYADGLFFCKDGDGVTVRNTDLVPLIHCDWAEWSADVLALQIDGKVAYYARIDA